MTQPERFTKADVSDPRGAEIRIVFPGSGSGLSECLGPYHEVESNAPQARFAFKRLFASQPEL